MLRDCVIARRLFLFQLCQRDCPAKRGNKLTMSMSMSIRPESQLVYEWYTPSLEQSVAFLQAVGFKARRLEAGFAEMQWGPSPPTSRLFVEEVRDDPAVASQGGSAYHGNVRVLVEDVDAVYRACLAALPGAKVLKPLEDRYYGLRDFTLGGPFGLALRFATPLRGFIED